MKKPPYPSRTPTLLTSFNPAVPVDGSLIIASVLRDQFNSLAALIAAIQSINNAVVDGVATLPPGDPATVQVSVDGSTLHFAFFIPSGEDGTQGPEGQMGPPGPQGAPGDPGEVQFTDLEYAINTQSSNISNDVTKLDMYVNDPPTQWDVQQIANKVDELIQALRR